MKATNWKLWVRVRQGSQILFFALFIFLLFAGLQRREVNPLADLFYRVNPLSALSAMIASRSWIHGMEWALLIIGLTVLVGRAWCGWICPTGTLLEWISFKGAARRAKSISPRWRMVKYALLVLILV